MRCQFLPFCAMVSASYPDFNGAGQLHAVCGSPLHAALYEIEAYGN